MSDPALWRLPEEALFYDHDVDRWHVMPARGLGASRAVFIPLRRGATGWEVALEPDERLPLTPVLGDQWTALPRLGGAEGCQYLCVLRYDLPSNHPDDSFFLQQAGEPPPLDVSGEHLQEVLQRICARNPKRIARDQVPGPPDADPAPSGAAPMARSMRATAARPGRSMPDTGPVARELSFAFGSCQYPAGMLDREIANQSYAALGTHLASGARRPERLLLLGDQVYVDATYGLLDPARLDDQYRMPYEDLRDRDTGPPGVLPMDFLSRVRTTPDDHEFLDNWEPWRPTVSSDRFRKGLEAFWEHQRRQPGPTDRPVYVEERQIGWRLFMTDTRTQRGYRSVETLETARIMGDGQEEDLRSWLLSEPADDLKIITSAGMLLPRSREYVDDPLYLDNWQGYPASFHALLALLCEKQVPNVVFLSGDAHLAISARVTVRNLESDRAVDFVSHHAPAFYAPYPFANESRYNLLLQDGFEFAAKVDGQPGRYACTVRAELVDEGHDGCGLLTATRSGGTWQTRLQVLRNKAEG